MKRHLSTISLFVLLLSTFPQHTVTAQNKRAAWMEEARYGMFIHWGLYSAAEGLWKGEKLRYLNNYAEWIRYRNRISKEEYGQLAQRFVWDKIDPEEWVLLAKRSGMKYIVMTSKHHDGVALWDTKIGDYSLPKLSGTGRDVIKEIADACRKHNMKLGFYYSHWIDWEHPYAWDHNQELIGYVSDEQFDQYWQEKALPQLRELLTDYGDIALMWFDMWIPYEKTIFKKEQLEQAVELIRSLQPNCLINSRLGLPTDEQYVDFQTLGDNQFGKDHIDHVWETPGTIAHSWGYNALEKEWKSTGQLFESLIGNVSLNGGLTLNIGPRADGTVPHESIDRLENIGTWLQHYGESIYGNTGIKLRAEQHDWGRVTYHAPNKAVYLHVFNWPLDNTLRLSGIVTRPTQVELLGEESAQTIPFEQHGPILHIQLPAEQADPYVSVIRLSYESMELEADIVAESTFGGFSLHSLNGIENPALKHYQYDGKRPAHVHLQDQTISWEVYLYEAGTYHLDLSAHNPNGKDVPIAIRFGDQVIASNIAPNGKVVAEPNEDNYTEEFVDQQLGEIIVDKPGKYTIHLQVEGDQPLWFNRVWIDTAQ